MLESALSGAEECTELPAVYGHVGHGKGRRTPVFCLHVCLAVL